MEYKLYKSWNVQVNCKIKVLNKIINFFKTKNIFHKDWVKSEDDDINILSTKDQIKDQIDFIDNKNNKK